MSEDIGGDHDRKLMWKKSSIVSQKALVDEENKGIVLDKNYIYLSR